MEVLSAVLLMSSLKGFKSRKLPQYLLDSNFHSNVLRKTPRNTYPITPVDITRVLLNESGVGENCSSTALAIEAASSRPPLPVTAFAPPELIMMALMPSPERFCRVSRLTVTGAA